jgi:transcription initiation factor TFIIIB Brf1 subunit/transcription initiation factor TFIIB
MNGSGVQSWINRFLDDLPLISEEKERVGKIARLIGRKYISSLESPESRIDQEVALSAIYIASRWAGVDLSFRRLITLVGENKRGLISTYSDVKERLEEIKI